MLPIYVLDPNWANNNMPDAWPFFKFMRPFTRGDTRTIATVKNMSGLKLNSGNLQFDIFGAHNEKVVFFCHSLGANRNLWDRQTEHLSREFKVIRIDLRGHGQSDLFETPYSIKMLALDVIALLDHLNVEKCTFIGLSLGSMIGLWLGIYRPERLTRMILAGASAKVVNKNPFYRRIAIIRQNGLSSIFGELNERWYHSDFTTRRPEIVKSIQATLLRTSVEGYIAAMIAVRDFDVSAQLAKVSTPTLLITGLEDKATPISEAQLIAKKTKATRLKSIKSASHLAIVEKPAVFDQALYSFVMEQ